MPDNHLLPGLSTTIALKINFIGEITGHSYIKMTLESAKDTNPEDSVTPLKGSYYEAVSDNTFKIMGRYDSNSHLWKLDCFDSRNRHTSTFLGKETEEGSITGTWSTKETTRKFYLKQDD